MRRILKLLILVMVLLVAAVVVGLTLMADRGIKRAVEVVGPRLTQVDVRLERASLSWISGRVALEGLFVGNPEGYKSDAAIKLNSLVLEARPSSFFAEKLIVKSVELKEPLITVEGGLKENNLSKIVDNVNAQIERLPDSRRGEKKEKTDDGASKKLQVDELVVTGGKVEVWMNLLGGRATTIDLPEIRMTDLGTGPEGITTAELTDRLLRVILEKATLAATGAASGSSGVVDGLKRAGEGAVNKAIDEATRNVTDLLKRKD